MPIIKVTCVRDGEEPAGSAAAIMATTLAKASEPISDPSTKGVISKPEKTRPQNPNRLTIRQHVFPVRSMQQFVDKRGRVSVFDILRNKIRLAQPKDTLFCAQRAWDQRAEAGYMKHIEDEFQKIVQPIIRGQVNTITPEQKPAIDTMFALWFMRTRYRRLDAQEIQLVGVHGDDLTKAQEENLESNGYLFARMGGKMPARQLNGVQLQMRIGHYARDLAVLTRWGVIHAQTGEFIVPDVPMHTIIPLTPKMALVASVPDGYVVERNLAEVNSALRASSREYYFARDFSKCPFLA
ncbi:hypothetical protein IST4116A_00067 [Burkholderia cenocepacia]|uniref:DUF4238 domain-containing protein n=1 Tax=Burkholderia multivorans TaxID=87883 RepID=UPI0009E0D6E3|nr:DUF4238 domain-containing protein [Burkholderia multivorans]CAB5082083.1 hypothetical protein IST4129_00067 [Burkholderia cenocepacia]CAB5082667.1 hypothetical protein IST439_00099 [Burkholderia cenocepacia]CAB5087415.1 hypothetical protein IST4134_00067 [Burkholderia cenocepacia]CAB5087416.1 hypothetical protein IST4116A_00067 [Burkholderia cenocepacia]CAB5087647.1 hypothetical protein IST4110_00067 [Burkholderia cenocepacia]